MKRSQTLLSLLAFQLLTTVICAQNVGIGETSPQAKLHIRGNSNLYLNSGFLVENSSNEVLMNIRNNGSIGIGIGDPIARFHIRNDNETIRLQGNNSYISFFDDPGGYKGYLWQKNGNGIELGTAGGSNYPISIAPGSIPEVTVLRGFTGLGNSDPAFRLDVSGRMRIRATDAAFTAGIWFNDIANLNTRAFIGMRDDNNVGFYGNDFGWGLTYNLATGNVSMTGNLTANSFLFVTPRNFHYSIPPVEFSAALSTEEVRKDFFSEGAYMTGSSTGLRAPVHLPQGATITMLTAFLYDNSAMDFRITLVRQSMATGDEVVMAMVSSTGSPGRTNIATASMSQPVVDNSTYAYYIRAIPLSAAWTSNFNMINGISIEYSVAEAQ